MLWTETRDTGYLLLAYPLSHLLYGSMQSWPIIETSSRLSTSDLELFHKTGLKIISESRKLILSLWTNNQLDFELKQDLTPVSIVDQQTEELVRDRLSKSFPTHSILGEEFENDSINSDFLWTIDPIDGTQNLINGIPTYGTLLGLRHNGQAVLGFIDHPALNLTCEGGLGIGVRYGGKKLSPFAKEIKSGFSQTDLIATSSPSLFERTGDLNIFSEIMSYHPHTRIYYDCYAHSLTVNSSLVATVEFGLKLWDTTPAEAMINELGGQFSYVSSKTDSSTGEVDRIKNFSNAIFGQKFAVDLLASHLEPKLTMLRR